MPYEGEDAQQAPKKKYSNLDEAMESLSAFSERVKNDKIERNAKYLDPEIVSEDTDTVTLQVAGGLRPITFSIVFETNDDHTAFLESAMDNAALAKHKGAVTRVMPHDEYEDWLARKKSEGKGSGDELLPDAAYYKPKHGVDYVKIKGQYGLLSSQIDHAHEFAARHILNRYRERAGKPPLSKEVVTYKYNFPSISPDKPAASKIVEETRNEPAPQSSWLDAYKPQF